MIKFLINGILNLVTLVLNIILLPINSLIANLFPDMTTSINQFTSFLSGYVGGSLSYFFSIMPPITRSIILLWLTFLIVYYGVVWSYSLIVKLWNVIQRIKFW